VALYQVLDTCQLRCSILNTREYQFVFLFCREVAEASLALLSLAGGKCSELLGLLISPSPLFMTTVVPAAVGWMLYGVAYSRFESTRA
jgi:hypothetical protein